MMISKERRGNRIRQSTCLFICFLISALSLFCNNVSGLGIQDLPLNDGNRTLTRISIKRTYPLNDTELQSLDKSDKQLLEKDDYGVLAFRSAYTTDLNAKRMIIMLHGFGRDAWQYQDTANDALYEAIGLTESPDQEDINKLKLDETLIISPQFLNEEDMELYHQTNDLQFDDVANLTTYDSPSIETTLVWQNTSWAEGADSILPTNISYPPDQEGNTHSIKAPSMSSFEVMDAMIDQATNKTRFPNLETIIVAGHSLGAQLVQRYALIGAIPSKKIPVHFFIANPGSYVYLTDQRPRSTKNCTSTYNEWKFGLGVFGIRYLYNMVITSLDTVNDITDVRVRYLRDRQVHYLYGLNDTGTNGDRRCQAMSQGRSHLERGRNYINHINQTSLLLHLNHAHTVDFVPGIAHDARGMFYSSAGVRRLFLSNIDGTESARGVGIADPDSNLYPYRFTQPTTNSANSPLFDRSSISSSILIATLSSLCILCISSSWLL